MDRVFKNQTMTHDQIKAILSEAQALTQHQPNVDDPHEVAHYLSDLASMMATVGAAHTAAEVLLNKAKGKALEELKKQDVKFTPTEIKLMIEVTTATPQAAVNHALRIESAIRNADRNYITILSLLKEELRQADRI